LSLDAYCTKLLMPTLSVKAFSYKNVLSVAQRITQKESSTAYRLSKFLFNRGTSAIFCLGYAYFRWLDDLVDALDATKEVIQAIVEKQKTLIGKLYSNNIRINVYELNIYEQMLYYLVKHDITNDCYLHNYFMNMFHAIEFDSQRRYQVSPQTALDTYSNRLGGAYTRVLQAFTSWHQTKPQADDMVYYSGFAAHKAHILRDFYTDISLGYYNISKESLAEYGWSIDQLPYVDLRNWVYRTVKETYLAFRYGLDALKKVQNQRLRFLGYATCAQYIFVLEKIRRNDYHLRLSYKPSPFEKRRMFSWALKAAFHPNFEFNQIEEVFQIAANGSNKTEGDYD